MKHAEKILFVDDDRPVRVAFTRSLRGGEFTVELAADGEEALQLAKDTTYAVVAVDYRMPGLDGLQLVSRLRELQPDATYMLVSGEIDLDLALKAVNTHEIPHVVCKPWDIEELRSLVQRAIASYWSRVGQKQALARATSQYEELRRQKERLENVLRTSSTNLAEMVLGALDLRAHETEAHCRRVAAYSRLLLAEMQVDETMSFTVELGALLHDIGKIGVPDAVLLKQGPLSEEEWEVMRRHTSMGAQLLDGFESLHGARDIVMQHHERWDGRGYPMRLTADQICLGARIFSIADTVDAIMSDRPYRKASPFSVAQGEVRKGAGSQFDPGVVAAFDRIPTDAWDDVRRRHPD